MEKQSIHVECEFAPNGDIKQIIHCSFAIYLDRMLAEDARPLYNQNDEWSLISGGQSCT